MPFASALAIAALEVALARAKAGEIVGVAIICVTKDRDVDWDISGSPHFHEINSALTLAQHALIREDRDGS